MYADAHFEATNGVRGSENVIVATCGVQAWLLRAKPSARLDLAKWAKVLIQSSQNREIIIACKYCFDQSVVAALRA
jgi:hypothetical protein